MKVLILGLVWPEPTSSAAGSRMMQIVELFQSLNWEVNFACAATKSEFSIDFSTLKIEEYFIKINDSSFDIFVRDLKPDLVVFDRFMVEEQFGWRVAENCPNALRVLDTEDLHCLRKGRQEALKQNEKFTEKFLINDYAKREIASIYRCDLSLIISEVEMSYLINFFGVPSRLLIYLPFMVDALTETITKGWALFEDRSDFVTIGNFRHEPNWDAIKYLKMDIWPRIRKQLPDAKLKVYGSYPSQKLTQLNNYKEGFLIMGKAKSAFEVIGNAKVLLAPLRVGAGLKGKLLEAMQCGIPSMTTTVGAEGMNGNMTFNGSIEDNPVSFSNNAVELYQNKATWQTAQENGIQIINSRFLKRYWFPVAIDRINDTSSKLENHRLQNFTGTMLQHQSLQATKFMSKWIEEKNKD